MSMMMTEDHMVSNHAGLRSVFTVVATALLTLILVPAVALLISYLAGGAATSTILFVYVFAFLVNGPFLLAAFALTLVMVAIPRLFSHRHA